MTVRDVDMQSVGIARQPNHLACAQRITQLAFRGLFADTGIAIGIQNDGFRRDDRPFTIGMYCAAL